MSLYQHGDRSRLPDGQARTCREQIGDGGRDRTFDDWWQGVGSGMGPRNDDDMESHALRVARAAWDAAIANRGQGGGGGMTDEETCYEFGDIQYEIEIVAPLLPERFPFRRLAAAETLVKALQKAIENHCQGVSVPDHIKQHCSHHAFFLNNHLKETEEVEGRISHVAPDNPNPHPHRLRLAGAHRYSSHHATGHAGRNTGG